MKRKVLPATLHFPDQKPLAHLQQGKAPLLWTKTRSQAARKVLLGYRPITADKGCWGALTPVLLFPLEFHPSIVFLLFGD